MTFTSSPCQLSNPKQANTYRIKHPDIAHGNKRRPLIHLNLSHI